MKQKADSTHRYSTPTNRVLADHVFLFLNARASRLQKKCGIYLDKNQIELSIIELKDQEKIEYAQWLLSKTQMGELPDLDKATILSEAYVMLSVSAMKYGHVSAISHEPMPMELTKILPRFSKVFEQTYTRFLDLQKAEAQAREAHVQLSFERVRARTMAMQHSKELSEIAVVMHKELVNLGVTPFLNCGYVEIDETNKIQYGWSTQPDGTLMEPYSLPLTGEPALQHRYEAWKRRETVFCQTLSGKDLRRHNAFVSPHLGSQQVDEMVKKFFPDPTIFYCANFSHGYLSIITGNQMSEGEVSLLTRFRKEFEQSYARFLDLQKAEAQAK
ncbi:MAG: hypothetical protein U5K79_01665 [Cyclobacteriaceae bacterium]|nr:hypothetical protein [Cyclobacteriaceae bacterium]